jgi:anti-sigma regulatory factor (Ser/Thr protein kinase)
MSSFLLSLPNTANASDVAEAFAARVAASAGLSEGDVARVSGAVSAAVDYAVQFAYPEARADQIEIEALIEGGRFSLCLRDHGEPQLPGAAADEDRKAAEATLLEKLDGLSPEWQLRGYAGKQLSLSLPLPGGQLESPAAVAPRVSRSEPVDADQYVVRRLEPRDAAGVARLVFRTYGYTYDDEDYYYPDRIVAENATGAMVSIVAVHPTGDVVGHYALEQRDPPTLYEGSSAVVDPVHRGKQLMERMRALAVEEGRGRGLAGIFFLPWTIHTVSQRANEHFGARLCAINLSDTSPVAISGFEEDSLAQRASTMLYFTPLGELKPQTVYAPDRHIPMLAELFRSLGRTVTFGTARGPCGAGVLETRELPHDRFGEIVVRRIGEDTLAAIGHAVRDFTIHRGAETVYLNLPLAQPGTADLATAAESLGFGFLGIGPEFAGDGDTLRLALITDPLDASHIHVLSELGQRLRDYALAEQERVSP